MQTAGSQKEKESSETQKSRQEESSRKLRKHWNVFPRAANQAVFEEKKLSWTHKLTSRADWGEETHEQPRKDEREGAEALDQLKKGKGWEPFGFRLIAPPFAT